MPAFSQNEISPEDLDHLVDYLKALRNHSGTGVTLMALAHKNLLPACYRRLGKRERSDDRFSPAR
jgi:hypothetical protein